MKSSPIFGMAAVILDDAGAGAIRGAVEVLRQDFKVPAGRVLSWKAHVKTHDRRRRAAEVLGSLHGVQVCYVYSVKSELRAGSYVEDGERFYNYVAGMTYKAVLWAARNWKGPDVRVWTRFGHVRNHDFRTTEAYLRRVVSQDHRVPSHLEQGLRWVSANTYQESQAADLYGGFLRAALWAQGDFGYVEPSYLVSVWHQIRNSSSCAIPLGIMSMPRSDLLTRNSWFPCRACPKANGPLGASRGRST